MTNDTANTTSGTDEHLNVPVQHPQGAEIKPISVLLVDDHPIVREGLSQLINAEEDLRVCGDAQDAHEAIERIKELTPDLVIVDVRLKGELTGIDLIRTLKDRYPNLPVLVLSMYDESMYAERALRAGARGYIMKAEASDLIMEAIRIVHRNEFFVSEAIKTRALGMLVGDSKSKPQSPVELLSDRELEVFRLIGKGRSGREIAEELHLSPKTVESHRANIKKKLKIKSGNELQRYAIVWVLEGGEH